MYSGDPNLRARFVTVTMRPRSLFVAGDPVWLVVTVTMTVGGPRLTVPLILAGIGTAAHIKGLYNYLISV